MRLTALSPKLIFVWRTLNTQYLSYIILPALKLVPVFGVSASVTLALCALLLQTEAMHHLAFWHTYEN